MNDPQTNAAADTAQTGAPAQPAPPPQQTTTDDGFERVPRDQYQTLVRNNERLRGMEGFYQKASSLGFKKPEDLEPWGKFRQFAEQRKLSPEKLMGAFQDDQQGQQQQAPQFDPDAFKKELSGQFEERFAMGDHKILEERASGLIQKAVGELMGENPSPRDQYLIKQAFMAELSDPKNLRLYGDGHPLASKTPMPHDAESLAKVVAHVKKQLGLAAGAEMAETGAAVNRGVKSAAGAAGKSAPTKPADKDDDDAPVGSPEHRKRVERYAAGLQAKRGGGAVSAAG